MRWSTPSRSARSIAQHSQDPRLADGTACCHEGEVSGRLGLPGWPAVAEQSIVARDVMLAEHTGSRLHVCHVSTAGTVEVIRWAKSRGIAVTAEVTPHHLLLTCDLLDGYDPVFKVNPPLRPAEDVTALRAALADGTIDAVATDHAPHAPHDKDHAFGDAAFGMLGLQTALGVVAETMVATGLLDWAAVADRMSTRPGAHRPAQRARRAGPAGRAGEPDAHRPGRQLPGRARPAGVEGTQHALRRPDPARRRRRHVPARACDGARRATHAGADAGMTNADGREGDRVTEAILMLEDGRAFDGEAYGAVGETFGEAVFATGMTGYQETLTDPSYHRQVVVQTAPHIGNTGVNDEDPESRRIWVAGYVVRDPARRASSWRATGTLDHELVAQGIVGISGIDTRALTRHLRERGAMRCGISSVGTDHEALLAKVLDSPPMTGADLSAEVTTEQSYVVEAIGEHRFTVASLDFGIKSMTPHRMAERGISSHVLPSTSSVEEVIATGADAVFLANGPGDPATADTAVATVRELLRREVPIFGICFGNQVLGRAYGFGTYKLGYGHRGINQPVQDLRTKKVEITAHNHGFAVDAPIGTPADTDFGAVEVSHLCLNDNVVEGLNALDARAFSVQYHPEAAAGPHDAAYLFDRFVELLEGKA